MPMARMDAYRGSLNTYRAVSNVVCGDKAYRLGLFTGEKGMIREMLLEDMDFSIRTESMLKRGKITSLEDLLQMSCGNLRRSGFTPSMIKEVRAKLAFHRLSLFGDVLISSATTLSLVQDIPKSLEEIQKSVRSLNSVLEDARHKIKDLEECLAKIISCEQYKADKDE